MDMREIEEMFLAFREVAGVDAGVLTQNEQRDVLTERLQSLSEATEASLDEANPYHAKPDPGAPAGSKERRGGYFTSMKKLVADKAGSYSKPGEKKQRVTGVAKGKLRMGFTLQDCGRLGRSKGGDIICWNKEVRVPVGGGARIAKAFGKYAKKGAKAAAKAEPKKAEPSATVQRAKSKIEKIMASRGARAEKQKKADYSARAKKAAATRAANKSKKTQAEDISGVLRGLIARINDQGAIGTVTESQAVATDDLSRRLENLAKAV